MSERKLLNHFRRVIENGTETGWTVYSPPLSSDIAHGGTFVDLDL